MSRDKNSASRLVSPRKWGLIVAAGIVAAHPVLPFGPSDGAAYAAGEAGEAGESGEAGIELSEGPAAYYTQLGLFEAAHRIVAALYAAGDADEAREHLENSHHAHYDDIAELLEDHGAQGFAAQVDAFAAAVNSAADPAQVAAAADAVIAAIDAARMAAQVSLRDQVTSIKELVSIAAADFDGGVEDGTVSLAMEYRDAWGFVDTARARAKALASSTDATAAEAGRKVLEQLDKTASLLPSVTASSVEGDPSALPGAAAWIEIIALKLK